MAHNTMLRPLRQAVFFDKDGTLIRDVPYNADPERVQLLPQVAEGLLQLQAEGYALVIVTNQAGIARGILSDETVRVLAGRVGRLLAEAGIALDGFYYCPHHPMGQVAGYAVACACRKPLPGLLLRAAGDLHLDRPRSWMVGDILDDVEAGHRAGCLSVLIDNGHETEWQLSALRWPDYRAGDMAEAVRFILSQGLASPPPPAEPAEPPPSRSRSSLGKSGARVAPSPGRAGGASPLSLAQLAGEIRGSRRPLPRPSRRSLPLSLA